MVTEKDWDSGREKEGESTLGRRWMMSAAEVTFLKDPSRTGCMICGAQCSENLESPIQTTNTATVEC